MDMFFIVPKKLILLLVLALVTIQAYAQESEPSVTNQESVTATSDPKFDWFKYEGNDPIYRNLSVGEDEFINPIIAGFYPDPSIVRVEDDYYMVHSSFTYFPGIPIFHSKDLVNWQQIGHVLDRPSQLPVDSLQTSRGVFAPTIEYHDGTFYLINTLVDSGGNYIVTTDDPAGDWSEPMWLNGVGGIDPSLFFDDDGKTYILNNDAPDEEPHYSGHRAIWIREYDLDKNQPVGEAKVLVNGGVDISEEPAWIEGPHMMKVDGEYFLHAAEGGTGPQHSQVVFKGDDPMGPFNPWDKNPILTQRHISLDRKFPVEYVGHADMVKTQNNEWWAVFLGVRPYDGKNFNTGRETFLLPVTWKEGWPVILEDDETVPVKLKRPDLPRGGQPNPPTHGNFTYTDDFNSTTLADYWTMIRTPREKWWNVIGEDFLQIEARSADISSLGNPSFIGRRQQHAYGSVTTKMIYNPKTAGDVAGLVAYQGEHLSDKPYYFLLGVRLNEEGQKEVFVEKDAGGKKEVVASKVLDENPGHEFFLEIEAKGEGYNFSYALEDDDWQNLYQGADGTVLSTVRTGGFTGTVIGMYAFKN